MEFQILSRPDFVQIDLGLIHGLQIIFLDSRTVNVRKQGFKSVVIKNAFAVKGLDHPAGCLSPAETGNVDPLAQLQESLLKRFGKLVRGDDKRQLRFVSGKFLVGVAHEYRSS